MGLVFGKRLTPMFFFAGTSTITYEVFLDDSLSSNKTFSISLSGSGFTLNVSKLNTDRLGGGSDTPKKVPVTLARRYRNIKHKISDSASVRTRFAGILNEGYYVRT